MRSSDGSLVMFNSRARLFWVPPVADALHTALSDPQQPGIEAISFTIEIMTRIFYARLWQMPGSQ